MNTLPRVRIPSSHFIHHQKKTHVLHSPAFTSSCHLSVLSSIPRITLTNKKLRQKRLSFPPLEEEERGGIRPPMPLSNQSPTYKAASYLLQPGSSRSQIMSFSNPLLTIFREGSTIQCSGKASPNEIKWAWDYSKSCTADQVRERGYA